MKMVTTYNAVVGFVTLCWISGTNSQFISSSPPCKCVPYYQCKNGTVNKNGLGIIDIRKPDGPCSNYMEVCCGKGDELDRPHREISASTEKLGCGRSNFKGVSFEITGSNDQEAQYGEFPWMVAVLQDGLIDTIVEDPLSNRYKCGGALIHPQVVVTAAHCVADFDAELNILRIRAGEWDTQTDLEPLPHQERDVASITIHPKFKKGPLFNDIALLFLKSPFEIADNVNVVCLPRQDTVVENTRCFASGWGKNVFGKEGKYQVILKKAELPIVPRAECQENMRNTRPGRFFILDPSFICAGGEGGVDTCKGDGGGPLVCPIPGQENRYFQAGIVAWGIGCGEKQIPGVYVNVAMFRDWIDEEMAYNKLQSTSYQE